MARPVATASRFRLYGALAGIVGALFGGGVGAFVGERLGFGYRFDWYLHPGSKSFPVEDILGPVAILAGALVAVLAAFGATLSYLVWDRRLRTHRAPAASETARPRDMHAVFLMGGLALGLSLFVVLTAYTSLHALGIDFVSPAGYRDVMAAAGGVAGFLAVYLTMARTGDALASGRITSREGENLIGRIALGSSRHGKVVVALVVALTLVAGYGVTLVNTNVDSADVLPRGDPNTAAAHNLTEKFKSSFTLQTTLHLRVAPKDVYEADAEKHLGQFRVTTPEPENISDEVYIRAIDELVRYVFSLESEGSPFVGSVALSDFYSIINWTIAGGTSASNASYSLPPEGTPQGEAMYDLVDRGVWVAIPATADALISPDYRQASVLFTVRPDEEMGSKEIGQWALKVRDRYVEWAESDPDAYKVFTGENAPMFSVDLPVANAHSSELANNDFKVLLPLIASFILVTLYIAFRNWVSIGVSFAMLAAAVVWTFGAMGALRIPLNTLNMTTLPLIMGVGIDYGIHMMNEYQESRAKGKSADAAWLHAGTGSALALFVATLTTVCGLLVMVVSPSLLIAQLGILSAIAIVSCFVLAVCFIPAFTSVLGGGVPRTGKHVEFQPSVIMPKLAQAVSRARVFAIVVLFLLAGSAYVSYLSITREPFGDPPRNWLADDPLRQEHEKALQGFYNSPNDDVKANILIFEGDINDPAAHRYMDALEQALVARGTGKKLADGTEGRVITDTLRTLPFLVRTYLTVRDGLPGAGGYIALDGLAGGGAPTDQYPTEREELEALLDEVHSSPLAGLANLFYDHPDDNMAMMLFSVKAASYEDAEIVWFQVQDALKETEALRPDHMRVSFFGNTAINYLFVAKEVPWLGYMSVATVILVFVIVLGATRSPKLAGVVATANFLTSLLWVGILPQIGIGLAITLTLPLIFIFAMGSDYALHLSMRCQHSRDTYGTMETVGKGVLFSFVTTLGAFAIFTQISNLAVRKTMIGTTVAIAVVMATTLLLVPIFYPVRKNREAGHGSGGRGGTVSLPVHGREGATRPRRMIVEMPPPATPTPPAPAPTTDR